MERQRVCVDARKKIEMFSLLRANIVDSNKCLTGKAVR